jgi:hypothetical protein
MNMDMTNLVIAIVSVVISNALSIGAVVWKVSGYFHKLQAEIAALNAKTELTNKYAEERIKLNESQVSKMFELVYDLQKRTTTIEVRTERDRTV